jgi:hypothetical protein
MIRAGPRRRPAPRFDVIGEPRLLDLTKASPVSAGTPLARASPRRRAGPSHDPNGLPRRRRWSVDLSAGIARMSPDRGATTGRRPPRMITTESEGRRSCSGKSPGCTVGEIRLRVRFDLAHAFSNRTIRESWRPRRTWAWSQITWRAGIGRCEAAPHDLHNRYRTTQSNIEGVPGPRPQHPAGRAAYRQVAHRASASSGGDIGAVADFSPEGFSTDFRRLTPIAFLTREGLLTYVWGGAT